MTNLRSLFAVAAALAIGALLGGGGLVQAKLGTGDEAIGGTPDIASVGAPRAEAPRVVGQCITNRTAYRTQTNQVSATPGLFTFVLMANTHLPVTHAAGCLIVDFSAEMSAGTADTNMIIRASISGTGLQVAEPPFAAVGRPVAANVYEMRSMRFVFPSVPAGTHTVRIEWSRGSGAGPGEIRNRTLTVQYR